MSERESPAAGLVEVRGEEPVREPVPRGVVLVVVPEAGQEGEPVEEAPAAG